MAGSSAPRPSPQAPGNIVLLQPGRAGQQAGTAADDGNRDGILHDGILHDGIPAEAGPAARSYGAAVHVLRPFRPLLVGDVLELGSDGGEAAHFLAQQARRVVAVRRTREAARRVTEACPGAPNVLAVTDALFHRMGRADFDAVVLTEPQASLWCAGAPEGRERLPAILARARGHLRPGGVLILAIDNRFALRHLAGRGEVAGESVPLSLEGLTRPDGMVLPGRGELRAILAGAGLPHQDWWFPFPDHRAPLTLIAERGLAPGTGLDVSALIAPTAPFDPRGGPHATFSVQRAWGAAVENALVADLANAFVVACSDRPLAPATTLALHYGHPRRPEFEKEVRFEAASGAIEVHRRSLYGGPRSREGVVNRFPSERFQDGRYWPQVLQTLLGQPGWSPAEVAAWADVWQSAVQSAFGLARAPTLATELPGHAIDAIPRNLLVGARASVFIDAEWDCGRPVPFGWLLVRGLLEVLQGAVDCAPPAPGTDLGLDALIVAVAAALGHALGPEELRQALDLERGLQSAIAGRPVPVDRETVAAAQLHVRSAGLEELVRVEQALAEATGAHRALLAEHARLKRRLACVEQEMLRGRLRADRELRALRLRWAERDAAGPRDGPAPDPAPPSRAPPAGASPDRPESSPEPLPELLPEPLAEPSTIPAPAGWRARLGRWAQALSAG